MTRKKPVETEVVVGAGASSRLVLVLKAETKSGYAGVTPNGKLWRARIYKSAKKQWYTVGTYESPRDAAIQLAIAQKEMAKGFGSLYSPLKRQKTGAHAPSPCLHTQPHTHMQIAVHCESGDSRCPHRYRICAPLRCMSLSGHGRGVRMPLQTRAVACLCLHLPQPRPQAS